jgi:hypothetical protein
LATSSAPITADAGNVDKPVTAIFNDDTFVLSGVEKPSRQVFVFGKGVDDCRVVDYDQLFTRNLGATQQLASENQAFRFQGKQHGVADIGGWWLRNVAAQ